MIHLASEEGRSTREVTLGVPVEDAIVTAFTRSTSGEVKMGLVLWNSFLGMMVAGRRDNARLVRVVNIGLAAMSGVWRLGCR